MIFTFFQSTCVLLLAPAWATSSRPEVSSEVTLSSFWYSDLSFWWFCSRLLYWFLIKIKINSTKSIILFY